MQPINTIETMTSTKICKEKKNITTNKKWNINTFEKTKKHTHTS